MNRDTVNGQNDRTGEMSTTNVELRAVLLGILVRRLHDEHIAGQWNASTIRNPEAMMYSILDTIDGAGYTVVATDRLERLIAAAEEYEIELEWRCGEYLNVSRQCTSVLRDGDLEGAS